MIPAVQRAGLAGLTLALAVVGVRAQEAGVDPALLQQYQAKQAALISARVGLIRPVTINGRELPADQIRRECVFLVGSKAIDAKIAEFFVADQLDQAIQAGRDPKEFEISEESVVQDIKDAVAQFQQQNPGIEFWDAVRAQFGMDKEQFLFQRRQTRLFDQLFFPGPATEWPEITREAIISASSQGDGKAFWDNLVKASVDEEGKARELPPFWMQLCRQWVQKQLKQWSDIRYPSDGLEPEFCLAVNERKLTTADAFAEIQSGLYLQDLERAVSEVVIREALRQELEKSGAFLGDEEFKQAFDEYRAPYDGTPFNVEVIATAFKGYPSLEAFRQRWRLIHSFEKMIAEEINDETLQAHADRFAAFFADGMVNVDVIQCLGRDVQTSAWLPDGMQRAEQRAEAAMQAIEGGMSFDDALAEYGEYYVNDKERGRFGAKSLNQLRQQLRESEFNDLLAGYSIGQMLYYDVEPGQVVGPLRGADAYFIARVNSKSPARRSVSVADERTRELVRQDYVNYRFLQWANEIVGRAEVQ